MLAILDYKAGNQTSVSRALTHLGIDNVITADADTLRHADGVIFPGVGAAGQAMSELTKTGLDSVLKDLIAEHKPLLGICVGCQIMLEHSEENDCETLGIIPGECRLFSAGMREEDGTPVRIPHMGWNAVTPLHDDEPLFRGISSGTEFYYVHSYYPAPAPEFCLATSVYGQEFCAMHGKNGLWAVQFHPEKSGKPGLQLLKNFHDYCMEASNAE
ncbi:imidazole glycerol phosphate synthase subunit HisH [Desulfobaculum bizertense]|uniref:Imidazole glycerol phosphate synthase subunit HisH n=1 Tax=Desulfobaculum bizertense DSM 18034 TaxID=1121442 RepID=A0A1T4W729_9BACT|nr:imidazole glycerol phosphate synthase subunit HisH [Desulfobaculum bizertense]SKA72997.1 imidazole glycerol phosphate synthase subunit hisH [Desulfobaculum bizertense DSM 18034]